MAGWILSNIVDNKQIQQFNRKGDIISISGLMTFLNIIRPYDAYELATTT